MSKCAPPSGQPGSVSINGERRSYCLTDIQHSLFFRRCLELLDPRDIAESKGPDQMDGTADSENQCMTFEWMDNFLWQIPSAPYRSDSELPNVIARSVLSALALLKRELDAIHPDISPKNIFLSDIHGPSPIVKLGDLGCMTREGYSTVRNQSLETRAPEGWRPVDAGILPMFGLLG